MLVISLTVIISALANLIASDPIGHISSTVSTNYLNWPNGYTNFNPEIPGCFSTKYTTVPLLRNISFIESRELLKQFQYKGCKGLPLISEDQLRMQECCEDIKAKTSIKTPSYGLYESVCWNLNILSLAQRICEEFKKNDSKYHSDFKALFASKDFTMILGKLSYIEFHKAMVSMILQHVFVIISRVEEELGWNSMDDLGRGGLDRISECFL